MSLCKKIKQYLLLPSILAVPAENNSFLNNISSYIQLHTIRAGTLLKRLIKDHKFKLLHEMYFGTYSILRGKSA